MADNVTLPTTGVGTATPVISTEEVTTLNGAGVSAQHVQRVLAASRTADGTAVDIPGSTANGLLVDVSRIASGVAVQLTDGTDVATISSAGSRKPLDMHLINSAGAIVDSFGGAGGTSALDDADFTPGTTPATPIQGVFESAPTSVTDGDMGVVAIDQNRRLKVSVDASALDVAHDAVDGSSAPVKIGGQARTSFPTEVANADRVNSIFDTLGRILTGHIAPGMQVHKRARYTTAQAAGAAASIWDPTSGKRIAITHITWGTSGITAARLTLFFADNADLTYTEGTDQLVWDGTVTPTSSATPGAILPFPTPIFCTTADRELKAQTDANLTIAISVYGYEW